MCSVSSARCCCVWAPESGSGAGFGIPGFAEGGTIQPNSLAMVGEKGPELVTTGSKPVTVYSNQESRQMMQRGESMSTVYSPGNEMVAAPSLAPSTFKLETTVINGVEYATVAQVREMGMKATNRWSQARSSQNAECPPQPAQHPQQDWHLMEGRTIEGWLIWLDQQRPTDDQWSDPAYLYLLCQVMISCIPRRCGQMLIDAGEAVDVRPDYRS